VFYVAAEGDRLGPALMRADFGAAVLVLPEAVAPPARNLVSFEVSGCRGYLLGSSARRPRTREHAA
jgi:hypothetical protein